MDVFVELKAIITEFQAKMAEARGEMSKTEHEGSGHFNTLSKVGGLALGGIVTAAAGVGVAAIKMGNELEDSQAKLEQAIRNTGGNFEELSPKIQAADKRMETFGFTFAQTNDALAAGTTSVGSASKALNLLSVAADLAAFKHIDLTTAMTAVAKASEGQLRPLKQLGIDFPGLAGGAAKVAAAQTALKKAQEQLTAAQAKEHPTAAQIAADNLSAQQAALSLQKANDAVTLAQQNVQAVLAKYKGKAIDSAAGSQALRDAQMKLSEATNTARIAAENHGKVFSNTGPHAAYEAAVLKVQDAQAKLTSVEQTGGNVLKLLSDRLHGQASAAANTFSGKMEVAKAKLEDMGAKLGLKLIPIIETFVSWLSKVVDWLGRHKQAAEILAGIIGGVLSATIAVFVATKLWHLVQGIQTVMSWFKNLGKSSTDAATVMGDAATGPKGFATKFSGAMTVIAAGVAAFQGTTALLKSNFLGIGGAVNDAARAISNFFGSVGQVKPSTSLTPQAISFLEQVASGAVVAANITPGAARDDLHAAHVPGYAIGGYVATGGLALLHAGETVIPASPARGFGGGDLVLQVGTQELGRIAGPAVRSWLLQTAGHGNSRKIGLA